MNFIFDRLFPDLVISSVYELPIKRLKEKGIKCILFDIDNTLAPYDVAQPDETVTKWLHYLKEQGFFICILSNNNKKRVKRFNCNLHALAVHKAGKPRIKKLFALLKHIHVRPEEAVMVGDQIFTDMWCGHSAGMLSILTLPICNRDQFVTKIKRKPEKWIMKLYDKTYPDCQRKEKW